MVTHKEIKEQIDELDILQTLTRSYAEIASSRMRQTRSYVLKNRTFLNSISNIFQEVRIAYARQLYKLMSARGKKGQRVTLLSHNGKTVYVFLSANTGLYGDVIQKTFRVFLEDVRKSNAEVTIVGRLGLMMFLDVEPHRPYTFFDLPDHGVTSDQMAEIIKHIVKYEKIQVYYGRFQSVISQVPDKYNISAEIPPLDESQVVHKRNYIFEPNLEKILIFFESEIFASLFDQSIRESELAKYASRILAMDQASENIKAEVVKMKLLRMRLMHRANNRKQVNSLARLRYI